MGAIILFDGVCNFCNGTVNFIIVRDRAGYYKFAPMQSEIGQGRERAGRLQAIAIALRMDIAGAENIWLRAILEDAHRDTTMIEQGPLLDIALIGAFRKGVQAERVSYETAMALAHSLGLDDAEQALTMSRDQLAGMDETLAGLLREIAA